MSVGPKSCRMNGITTGDSDTAVSCVRAVCTSSSFEEVEFALSQTDGDVQAAIVFLLDNPFKPVKHKKKFKQDKATDPEGNKHTVQKENDRRHDRNGHRGTGRGRGSFAVAENSVRSRPRGRGRGRTPTYDSSSFPASSIALMVSGESLHNVSEATLPGSQGQLSTPRPATAVHKPAASVVIAQSGVTYADKLKEGTSVGPSRCALQDSSKLADDMGLHSLAGSMTCHEAEQVQLRHEHAASVSAKQDDFGAGFGQELPVGWSHVSTATSWTPTVPQPELPSEASEQVVLDAQFDAPPGIVQAPQQPFSEATGVFDMNNLGTSLPAANTYSEPDPRHFSVQPAKQGVASPPVYCESQTSPCSQHDVSYTSNFAANGPTVSKEELGAAASCISSSYQFPAPAAAKAFPGCSHVESPLQSRCPTSGQQLAVEVAQSAVAKARASCPSSTALPPSPRPAPQAKQTSSQASLQQVQPQQATEQAFEANQVQFSDIQVATVPKKMSPAVFMADGKAEGAFTEEKPPLEEQVVVSRMCPNEQRSHSGDDGASGVGQQQHFHHHSPEVAWCSTAMHSIHQDVYQAGLQRPGSTPLATIPQLIQPLPQSVPLQPQIPAPYPMNPSMAGAPFPHSYGSPYPPIGVGVHAPPYAIQHYSHMQYGPTYPYTHPSFPHTYNGSASAYGSAPPNAALPSKQAYQQAEYSRAVASTGTVVGLGRGRGRAKSQKGRSAAFVNQPVHLDHVYVPNANFSSFEQSWMQPARFDVGFSKDKPAQGIYGSFTVPYDSGYPMQYPQGNPQGGLPQQQHGWSVHDKNFTSKSNAHY